MEMVSWGMEIHSPVSYLWSSDWLLAMNKTGSWTMAENKIFEKALALHDKETPDRWQKIVEMIPGKSLDEVKRHYRDLEEDVSHIEAGLIPIPGYNSSPFTLECVSSRGFDGTKRTYGVGGKRSGARPSDHERKKGVPWTEEEHRLFLMGLKKYGKGDWRNISRNFVISRTPTQVASHAQKYFIRLSSGGKDKRRSSIHDITTVNIPDNGPPSPTTAPSSTVKTETAEHLSGALNTNQCKEAAAFFNSMASQTNSNLFAHHPYGSSRYGVKYEPQTLHQDNLHESVVGQQEIFHRLQSGQCHPHE